MKRTKQRADRNESGLPEYVSGCRQFEGEDRYYNDRMAQNAAQQQEWCQQQIREKKAALAQEDREDRDYAEQTEAINRFRGCLEDEMTDKRNAALKA